MSRVRAARQFLAVWLCCIFPLSQGRAQQATIAPSAAAVPGIVRRYFAVEVPPVRLANSPRLAELVRAGTLYLTAQDAIALALENNIDLEVDRYNPLISAWNLTRSQAGGALPGVPSNASQAGSVAIGQGVSGSQAAAGVRILGSGSNRGTGTNAQISQIGPITQTLDPSLQEASTFSHSTTPLANVVQSGVFALATDTRATTGTYQQGFLTGGNVTVTYTDNYLKENALSDVLNPSSAPSVGVAVQQNLAQGFGAAVNARFITVAKMNLATSDLTFETQVISTVVQVLNAYYGLAADDEDIKAKTNAAEVARKFWADVKEQARIGTLAPSDQISAESQAVTAERALVDSNAARQQQEIQLKNLLSRTGSADPVLRDAHIVPTDRITIPDHDDLAPLDEMVKQALANRIDFAVERQNEAASEVSLLGTKNGILPNVGVFAGESQVGLAGAGHTVTFDGISESPNPYFVGGIGKALGQVFQRDFATERAGAFYFAPLRNRAAQADYAIDQLSFRQTQLTTHKDLNQVEVDIQNNVVALRQARSRYDAAVHNRTLQEQLLAAEQKKFSLGASVPYNVLQQQRDLVAAQSTETAALVAYSSARIGLDRSLGATLAANHITVAAARAGFVGKQ